jgi:formylglycine-generating enzyme required for sulfatase activity
MAMMCSKCGAAMEPGDRFCGSCAGPPREVAETPEAVAQYEEALREFASDGVLEDWERDELTHMRRDLGVSEATHAALLAKYQPVREKLPVVLELDEATLSGFAVGAQGVVRARIKNGGPRALKNVVARHAVTGESGLREHAVRLLGPGRDEVFMMVVQLERPGQYVLETVLSVQDMLGKGQYYRAAPQGFRVGERSGGGPQSITMNIDASGSAAIFDGVGAAGGAGRPSSGGALDEVRWRDLGLRLMSPDEWAAWELSRDAGARERAAAEARAKADAEARAKAEAEAAAARAKAEAEAAAKAKAAAEEAARGPAWVQPWTTSYGQDAQGAWATASLSGVTVKLRWCPPGTFWMGSPESEEGRFDDEGPRHEVQLTRGFWLGETPVTQSLWEAVMGSNPSEFQGAERPVEQVSWEDCQQFLSKANVLQPGLQLRLPTEAEWEYACRAGTTGATWLGSNDAGTLNRIAWYEDNSGAETHPVRQKEGNPWGLYDMLGNVWEWCSDWRDDYSAGRAVDPAGAATGPERVYRGGSWFHGARYARAAHRSASDPGARFDDLGFRLARGQ